MATLEYLQTRLREAASKRERMFREQPGSLAARYADDEYWSARSAIADKLE